MSSDPPWGRVREPLTIPRPLSVEALRDGLSYEQFVLLLRSHLVPRDTTAAYRRDWNTLWTMLRAEQYLNDEATTVLSDLKSETEAALASGDLDEAGTRRAKKFRQNLADSLQRLQIDSRQPAALEWAGGMAAQHPERSRRVIASLVAAIARHRAAIRATDVPRDADEDLWETLGKFGVDPDDHPDLRSR